jgi:D-glycero-alpha-D-manno-heptose-7-phosphate kinase
MVSIRLRWALRVSSQFLCEFEGSLFVCFTGESRASAIIQDQVKAATEHDRGTLEAPHQLKSDAVDMKQALLGENIRHLAEVLNRSWQAKRKTSKSVSNARVEAIFELGLNNGAVAGKVSGAGGGSFLMFMTDPEHRYRLVSALTEAGAHATPLQFTDGGAQSWAVIR